MEDSGALAHAHLAAVMEPVLRILHDEHHLQLHDVGMPLDGADLNFLELWSQLEVYRARRVSTRRWYVHGTYVACQGVVWS